MKTSKMLLMAYPKAASLLLLLFVGLLPQLAFSAENYKVGDKLYIAPTTGANIRTQPSLQAPVLAKLAYNTIVTVAADAVPTDTLQVKVNDFNGGFLSLQGHWVKIKAGKVIGYVFDGMLSNFKGLETGIHEEEAYYTETFGTPAKKVIKKSEVIEGHRVNYETVIKTYPQGLVVEHTFSDGCHDLTYTFKTTFNEAYWLIARILQGGDAVQEAKIEQAGGETVLTFYSCT